MGAGFVGTGPGWTARTRARPVCHPNDERDEKEKRTNDPSDD